jgi:aspartyl-tRNA(Asn)/glutamyl-tRNA(Gln) amidotransferase subunit C
MSLTLSDVNRIANLAQLDMDEAHAEIALTELNGIFALAEQMQAVDTTGVEPLSQPLAAVLALPLRLREDVVTEENHREDYQAPAPATQDGLYLVPKVIATE